MPDGSKIAFTQRRAEDDPHAFVNFPGDIQVMNADGSNLRNLSGGATVGFLGDEDATDEEPSWQPLEPGADRVAPAFAGPVNVPAVVPILTRPTRAVISTPRRGTPIRLRISVKASAKLTVERVLRRRKGKRFKLKGWIVRPTKRGRNRVLFTGRIGRKPLKPGLYRIRAGAVDRTANPARQKRSRSFRVVRLAPR